MSQRKDWRTLVASRFLKLQAQTQRARHHTHAATTQCIVLDCGLCVVCWFQQCRGNQREIQTSTRTWTKGLSVAFDLPTQLGLDADDEMSEGEVGKVGVSISCLDDMRILSDISLDKVSTSMTINAPAMVLLAMYVVVAEESGVLHKIRGTIQNDILKEYIEDTHIFPPEQSMRLITDIFEYCENILDTISISGYHIRELGSTAVKK